MNTTYWLNEILQTMYFERESYFQIGLSSTEPDKQGGSFTEPQSGSVGYERANMDSGSMLSSPEDGMIKNTQPVEFPRSTGVWFDSDNKAKYWLLFNSSGLLLSWGELDEPKTVESNTMITIAEETLSITLTDYIED